MVSQHVVEITENGKTIQEIRPTSPLHPLPINLSKIGTSDRLVLNVDQDDFASLLDVLERIQQQLAMINNGNDLAPGERFY